MKAAVKKEVVYGEEDGEPTEESLGRAFSLIGRILKFNKEAKDKPHLKQMMYIRGILRNRLNYVNEGEILNLLNMAVIHGINLNAVEALAKECSSWTKWKNTLVSWVSE